MMEYKLLVYNSQQQSMYDYEKLVKDIEYTTNREGSPGKLKFSYIQEKPINMIEGAQIQLVIDGENIFLGYVFIIEQSRDNTVSVTAYDQIRYLKAEASYSFVGKTLGQIIKQIAADFHLQVGYIEETGYIIPTLTKEEKSCINIIAYAISMTQVNTGRTYVFYDDFGELCLREAANMKSSTLLGEKSQLTDYKYKSDIDSDTYNQVKLVRPNKDTGRSDVYIFQDKENQAKWGLLQYYQKVDENLNTAQIDQQGNVLMAYYNRVLKSITAECLGVLGLKAGAMACFKVNDVPELSDGYFLLLDKVVHKFRGSGHTMSIEAKIITI